MTEYVDIKKMAVAYRDQVSHDLRLVPCTI
jgi:hypothetical protein